MVWEDGGRKPASYPIVAEGVRTRAVSGDSTGLPTAGGLTFAPVQAMKFWGGNSSLLRTPARWNSWHVPRWSWMRSNANWPVALARKKPPKPGAPIGRVLPRSCARGRVRCPRRGRRLLRNPRNGGQCSCGLAPGRANAGSMGESPPGSRWGAPVHRALVGIPKRPAPRDSTTSGRRRDFGHQAVQDLAAVLEQFLEVMMVGVPDFNLQGG